MILQINYNHQKAWNVWRWEIILLFWDKPIIFMFLKSFKTFWHYKSNFFVDIVFVILTLKFHKYHIQNDYKPRERTEKNKRDFSHIKELISSKIQIKNCLGYLSEKKKANKEKWNSKRKMEETFLMFKRKEKKNHWKEEISF